MNHVFVYGTLLFPEIVEGLCGISFHSQKARLAGYRRCSVKGADYPAIIAQNESNCTGKILFNIDERSFEMLRFFEGEEYSCIEVEVETETEKFNACAFVWAGLEEKLNKEDWNQDHFKRNTLADYLRFVIPETRKEFNQLFL